MQSIDRSRQPLGRREEGIALIVTLMVLMLVSVLMVGFVASIIADTRASGLDRDQTQAYAATHAGLEQITSDLSNLFVTDFSPTTAQITALTVTPPVLPGFTFIAPGGAAGSGYAVVPRFLDAGGNPRPEDPVNGSAITAGPYQGFRGIITPVRHHGHGALARRRGSADAPHAADGRDSGVSVRDVLRDGSGVPRRRRSVRLRWARAHERQPVPGGCRRRNAHDCRPDHGVQGHHPDALAERPGHHGWLQRPGADSDHDREQPGRERLPQSPADRRQHYGDDPSHSNPHRAGLRRLGGAVAGDVSEQHSQRRHGREEARPADRRRSRRQWPAGRRGDRAHPAPRARLGRERRHARAEKRLHAAILRAGERAHPAVGHGGRNHEPADGHGYAAGRVERHRSLRPLPSTRRSRQRRRFRGPRSARPTRQERSLGQPAASCRDTSTRAITTTRSSAGSSRSRSKGSLQPGRGRPRACGRT